TSLRRLKRSWLKLLEDALQALKKPLLFLRGILVLIGRRGSVRWGAVCCDNRLRLVTLKRLRWGARSRTEYRIPGPWRGLRIPASNLGATTAVKVTELRWLRTDQVVLGSGVRTGTRCELPAQRVDLRADNSLRDIKIDDITVGAVLVRSFHEIRPDGQCGFRAFDFEILVVVETHPDDAQQLGRETREPGIVGGTGLTSRRQIEPAPPHTIAGAAA